MFRETLISVAQTIHFGNAFFVKLYRMKDADTKTLLALPIAMTQGGQPHDRRHLCCTGVFSSEASQIVH